jgi:large subunit ribosomal protein L25
MDTVTLDAQPRAEQGHQAKYVRRAGQTPAVVYGHGVPSQAISVDTKTFATLLPRLGTSTLMQLKIPGQRARNVLVKKVQRDPVTRQVIHVDFHAVRLDQKIRAEVSIHFVGESPATRTAEMMVVHGTTSIQVEALPGDLPHAITVDLSQLTEADQAIYARDLTVGEGVTILSAPDEMIARVHLTKAAYAEEPELAAGPAEEQAEPDEAAAANAAAQANR